MALPDAFEVMKGTREQKGRKEGERRGNEFFEMEISQDISSKKYAA